MFLPPLLNLFCFCRVLDITVLYCVHLCMKCFFGISNFLEEISSFAILLFSSISLHCSHKKTLSLLAILWNSALNCLFLSLPPLPFTCLFSALCKVSQTTTLPCCISLSLGWFWSLLPCTMLWTSIHHSSGTLSTRFCSLVVHNSSASWISLPGYSLQRFK